MLGILAALMLAAAPQYDTVYTEDGGRLVGTVIEDAPQGIAVQLPDGSTRRLERRQVTRIEYADGSVTTPNRPAPPPPTYPPTPSAPPSEPPRPASPPPPAYTPPPPHAPPPPPVYTPPPPYAPPPPPVYRPPPPPYRPPPREQPPGYAGPRGMDPILPVYGVFGIGGAFMSGDAATNIPIDRVFDPQLDLWLEGGLRLNLNLALGLYVDVGLGDPAREIRNDPACTAPGLSCTATTTRVGVLLRHTFSPRAYSTPWIAAGTGFDWGSVNVNEDHGGGSSELFHYSGWEALRLMAGVDIRSSPVFGVGFYGGVAFGRYTRFEDNLGSINLHHEPFHTTVQAGLRFTLFP